MLTLSIFFTPKFIWLGVYLLNFLFWSIYEDVNLSYYNELNPPINPVIVQKH